MLCAFSVFVERFYRKFIAIYNCYDGHCHIQMHNSKNIHGLLFVLRSSWLQREIIFGVQ